MADVFVSYASADSAAARALAERIEQEGFSVWWDRKIPIGQTFDKELDQQLDAARCVLVLWSRHSVKSEWVKNEAAEGLAKKALFPVRLDPVRLPFGYRRLQTADLVDWTPAGAHPAIDRLAVSLRETLGVGHHVRARETATPIAPAGWFVYRWRRSMVFRVVATALPVVVLGVGAVAMAQMRVPTPVRLDLTVRRVEFTVGGSGVVRVLDPLAFSSLRVEHFGSVTLAPKVLSVEADPNPDSTAGPGQWHELNPAPNRVTLTALGSESSVWIEPPPGENGQVGTLDGLYVPPGSVVRLELKIRRRNAEISVRIEKLPKHLMPAATAAGRPFRMYAGQVDAGRLLFSGAATARLFEVQTKESSPAIEITSESDRLDLGIGMADAGAQTLLVGAGTPISQPVLMVQNADQEWESTLLADAHLSYPDHSNIAPVTVFKQDLVGVEGDPDLTIAELGINRTGEGLNLQLAGRVKKLKMKSGQIERDGRLTVLEVYRSKAVVVFWVTMIVGAVSALWSAFTALRELRA